MYTVKTVEYIFTSKRRKQTGFERCVLTIAITILAIQWFVFKIVIYGYTCFCKVKLIIYYQNDDWLILLMMISSLILWVLQVIWFNTIIRITWNYLTQQTEGLTDKYHDTTE